MFFKLSLAFVLACAVSAQLLPPLGIRRVRPGPTIQTPAGPIQGQEETYEIFRRIYTYKGIRYGQAPVSDLRFRQALPVAPWTQVLQAWDYGAVCPQFTFVLNRVQGNEDCLFLNIATPTNIRSRLPVVISIHGGGLQFGNGEISRFGPELINREEVIFVSMNYRLHVLGFLNTGDASSPGNYGLKDMILALQWVQNNIEAFGGNRDDVTIYGISGGAVAVHALVVSQAAAGLFHKAVAHSGSLFNPWGFSSNPTASVQMLIRNLELQVANNEDLMAQLRQVSIERLLSAIVHNMQIGPDVIGHFDFMPSVDPLEIGGELRIFTGPISSLVRQGNVNRVPFMVGFNSFESMDAINSITNDWTVLERFNMNPHLLIPTEWDLMPGSQEAQEVITAFRNLYFSGASTITQDMTSQWATYVSDRNFNFGVSRLARMHTFHQSVYYYLFDYSGSLNFGQRLSGLSGVPGMMHGDDTFYIFRFNSAATPVLPSDEAFTVQNRYVRLMSNFFRFSNPTPTLIDPLINTIWPLMTEQEQFMNINNTLTVDFHPFRNRMDVWHSFDSRFNQ